MPRTLDPRSAGVGKISNEESVALTLTEERNVVQAEPPEMVAKHSAHVEPGQRKLNWAQREDAKHIDPNRTFGYFKSKPEDLVHADDVLKPQQHSKLLQESIQHREMIYSSAKQGVGVKVGANNSGDLPDKFRDPKFAFGANSEKANYSAKFLLNPEDLPEELPAEERKRRARLTHNKQDPGVQTDRGFDLKGAPPTGFGKIERNRTADGQGVATSLGGEKEERNKTHIVTRRAVEASQEAHPPIGKTRIKVGEPAVPEDVPFGAPPPASDEWNAGDIITGGLPKAKKGDNELFVESALRPSVKHIPKSKKPPIESKLPDDFHAVYALDTRTHGLPSVIRDRKAPKKKSLANAHAYGDEPSAKELVFSQGAGANEIEEDKVMGLDEIAAVSDRIQLGLTRDEIATVYEAALKDSDIKDGVTLERFRANMMTALRIS